MNLWSTDVPHLQMSQKDPKLRACPLSPRAAGCGIGYDEVAGLHGDTLEGHRLLSFEVPDRLRDSFLLHCIRQSLARIGVPVRSQMMLEG